MSAAAAIREQGIVAIVRAATAAAAAEDVRAVLAAGLRVVEVSLVTPDAIEVIRDIASEVGPDVAIGIGTALTADDVDRAVSAGASFVVAPTVHEPVIRAAVEAGVTVLPGAATPSEALTAIGWGAPFVKLFPASLWTPAALRDVLTALPQVPFVPTGGISLANVGDWISAGAVAVGVGSSITKAEDPERIAREYLQLVSAARAQKVA
ncbi:bifunctional 4-hydroxy-2-oxoglutarate aldolase/2-dehydro-3-deoxy-phosphogluconate aldolase [Agromyces sp. Leaf222]|uniref:bifunctional 4-hydroxy-2-oxoglutarate aldolase/2-dehydro-3-deoxy-phosphogluconate aldolase n=1 Tax=Agromyces sp. Leaf222 TaxID=1735688 RepID=UPI0006FC2A6B|nr:bifunctional 4-hydroxy-2-oxoglutarate aldolase/2-dehydro-3-deoxy-phosphogluconate aldolase [Agromyces sp. Leaf222]KQM83609.1 hypothetical protein ASE68_10595 [Agromyces sp. Leaf222]